MGQNSEYNSPNLSSQLALGETMAYSILPIPEEIDKNTAEIIRENFIDSSSKDPDNYMKDGIETVADSLGSSLVEWGVDCKELGQTSQVKPCRSVEASPMKPLKRPAKKSLMNDPNSSADRKFGAGWMWSLAGRLKSFVPSKMHNNDKTTLLLYSIAGIIGSSTFLMGCLNCWMLG